MKVNELKCSDLRIGNYLKYNNKIVEVFGLRPRYIEYYDEDEFLVGDNPEYFEPIELTEELLLKIGFEKINDCYVLQNEYICLAYYKDSFKQELVAGVKRKGKCLCHINELKNYDIKYLHELQNAYYLLTNEELEVEL